MGSNKPGKGGKRTSTPSRKARRLRSSYRLIAKKDRNVKKSSHGVFQTVADLKAGRRAPKATPSTRR